MKTEILGIKISEIDLVGALARINDWLGGNEQRIIARVNPEFVVAARRQTSFAAVINRADLATVDGYGLVCAGKFLNGKKLDRVTGVDLSKMLLEGKLPEAKVYLLGGAPGVAEAVRTKYVFKGVVGAESGGALDSNYLLDDNDAVIGRINDSGANVVLVAFGQIKQEEWISKNLEKMPGVRVAIGVGGTFDYLSGRVKRAPKLVRLVGLEWLYRLILEPKRFKRIYNAVIVFSFLVLREKLKKYV